MLVGIAVKNAILVVEFTKQLRHGGMDAREALMRAGADALAADPDDDDRDDRRHAAARTRHRGWEQHAGAARYGRDRRPATSTLLSLVVVPALYLWVQRNIASRFKPKPPRIGTPKPSPLPQEEAVTV